MFILDDDLLDVIVYYKKIGRVYTAYGETEFNENVKEDIEKLKFKKLTVSMKLMTWGLYNELQELAVYYNEISGKTAWNNKKYKEEKLKRLIVKWDAVTKNKDGKEIPAPINSNTIMSMSPSIAETILSSYDERSVLSEDELGK